MKLKVRARILSACMVLSVLVTACGSTTENLDTESVNVETTEVNEIKIINDSLGYMVCEIIEKANQLFDMSKIEIKGE